MYEKPPPREIADILAFPITNIYKSDKAKFYNKVAEDQVKRQNKYQKASGKLIIYEKGENLIKKSWTTQHPGRNNEEVIAVIHRTICNIQY